MKIILDVGDDGRTVRKDHQHSDTVHFLGLRGVEIDFLPTDVIAEEATCFRQLDMLILQDFCLDGTSAISGIFNFCAICVGICKISRFADLCRRIIGTVEIIDLSVNLGNISFNFDDIGNRKRMSLKGRCVGFAKYIEDRINVIEVFGFHKSVKYAFVIFGNHAAVLFGFFISAKLHAVFVFFAVDLINIDFHVIVIPPVSIFCCP